MGKRLLSSGSIAWVGFIVLFLVVNALDNHRYQSTIQSIKTQNVIPPPIPGKEALFYSNIKGVWIYNESVGAKASHDTREPNYNSEDDIEKYLQRHIPAYKKKTYWGEEWNEYTGQEEDIIWDEHGDDEELDYAISNKANSNGKRKRSH